MRVLSVCEWDGRYANGCECFREIWRNIAMRYKTRRRREGKQRQIREMDRLEMVSVFFGGGDIFLGFRMRSIVLVRRLFHFFFLGIWAVGFLPFRPSKYEYCG